MTTDVPPALVEADDVRRGRTGQHAVLLRAAGLALAGGVAAAGALHRLSLVLLLCGIPTLTGAG